MIRRRPPIFFEETIGRLKTLFNIQPEAAVCDLHPDYPSTRYVRGLLGLPVYAVQHHHAHAVSVMAEYGLKGPCIAVILDGAGLGADRTIWGGEVLLADLTGFRRLARLGHLMLPGGDAAAREPWRMAMSAIFAAFGPDGLERAAHFFPSISSGKRDTLASMLINRINTPPTSSCGRLFDAVSALLGLCLTAEYEGQAAMGLEAISLNAIDEREMMTYPIDIREDDGLIVLDYASIIRSVLRDIEDAVPPAMIGFSFHIWLINGVCAVVKSLAEKTGIKDVVLGGGCMQNKIILEGLIKRLGETGLVVYAGESVPANDGGLSLGQLVIGGARHVSGHTNGGR